MTQLDRDRDEIDRIDAQIAELFEKRFRTVEDVIQVQAGESSFHTESGQGRHNHGEECCTYTEQ
jgi:chorismate mutase